MTSAVGRPGLRIPGRDVVLVSLAAVLAAVLALVLAPLGTTALYGIAGLVAAGAAGWWLRAELLPPVHAAIGRLTPATVPGLRVPSARTTALTVAACACSAAVLSVVAGERALLAAAGLGALLVAAAAVALCWPLVVDLLTHPPEDTPVRPRRRPAGPRSRGAHRQRTARLAVTVAALAAIAPASIVLAGIGAKAVLAAAGLLVVVTLAVLVPDRSVCFTFLTVASLAVVLHKSLGPQDLQLSGGAISVYVTSFDALVLLLYGFWIREGTFRRDLREGLRRRAVWWPLVGAGLLLPSLLVAESPWHAAGELARMGFMYLLYVYVAVRVRTRRHVWAVLGGLAVFAVLEFVVVLGQAFTGGNLGLSLLGVPETLTQRIAGADSLGRPFGTIIHPVFMGAVLGCVLLVALSLAIHLRRSVTRIVAAALVVACGLPLYLAHARAATLAVAVATLYVVATGLTRGRLTWSLIGRVALAGALVGLALLPQLMEKFSDNFFTAHFWEEIQSRLQLNTIALDMWHDHWVLGVGLNNFELVLPRYEEHFVIFFGNPVHNLYLLYLAETGVPGLLGVVLVGGGMLAVAARAARSRDRLLGGTAIGVVGAMLFLAIEELWGFSLRQDVPLAVYWLLAGLAVACGRLAAVSPPGPDDTTDRVGPPLPVGPSSRSRSLPAGLPRPRLPLVTHRLGSGRPPWIARGRAGAVVVSLAAVLVSVPQVSGAEEPLPSSAPATTTAAATTTPDASTADASTSEPTTADTSTPEPTTADTTRTGTVAEATGTGAAGEGGPDSGATTSAPAGEEDPDAGATGSAPADEHTAAGSTGSAGPPAPSSPAPSPPLSAATPGGTDVGQPVVFEAEVRSTQQVAVFTAAPDGSGVRQVTPSDGLDYSWPRWAYGNRKIVYTVRDPASPDPATGIGLMNADGSDRRIIATFDYAVGQPRIDSTGRWMYFTAAPPWFPDNGVFRMDLRTLESVNLTGVGNPVGGLDADPALAPGERSLYVIAGGTQQADVVRMSVDGTDRVVVTSGGHWNTDPDVSPDGRQLAISSYRGPDTPAQGRLVARPVDFHLVLHDVASGAERVLTAGTACVLRPVTHPCDVAQMSAYAPRFTPSGTRIAFTGALDGHTTCICLIGTDGSDARPLISSTGLAISWFDVGRADGARNWAQIGSEQRSTRLLVTMADGEARAAALVEASPDLMHRTVLPLPAGLEPQQARWSPDRRQVVFTARVPVRFEDERPHPAPPRGSQRREHLTMADLDPITYATRDASDVDAELQVFLREPDGSVRQLTDPWTEDWRDGVRAGDARANTDPVFTDGGRAVLVTNTSALTGESFVLRIDLATGGVLNLTNATSGAMPVDDRSPAPAPAGGRVAFSWTQGAFTDVYTMAPDGSDVRVVTTTEASDTHPAWLPGGSALVTVASGDGGSSLVRTDVRSGARSRLAPPVAGALTRPVVAPEGDRVLALGVGGPTRTALTVPVDGGRAALLQPDPVHQYLDLDWR